MDNPGVTCGRPRDRGRRSGRATERRAAGAAVLALCAAAISACADPPPDVPVASPAAQAHAAHVVSNGWHTGIVIDRASLAASGLPPEAVDFPDAPFLEFGWGDRDFYMAVDETLWITLKAALVPTPAVMHVAALERPPEPSASVTVVRLSFSEPALQRLIGAVSASFDRSEGGAAMPIGPGRYGDGRFYPATGRFHLLDNCNTWTARVLSEAGVPISPAGVVTARTLMHRVQKAAGLPASRSVTADRSTAAFAVAPTSSPPGTGWDHPM